MQKLATPKPILLKYIDQKGMIVLVTDLNQKCFFSYGHTTSNAPKSPSKP